MTSTFVIASRACGVAIQSGGFGAAAPGLLRCKMSEKVLLLFL
jgi:hypothetical protein